MAKKQLIQNELVEKFDNNSISKQELGKLRRMILEPILANISSCSDEDAAKYLDGKKSRLDKGKLAKLIGYKTEPVNLRQSFREEIRTLEEALEERGVIVNKAKSNQQVHDENITGFLKFIHDRLNMEKPAYYWPVNNKGRLYQKVIWAYYLNQDPVEIKSGPSFFSSDRDVKAVIAGIDTKLANDEILKTIDYASESALEEMKDNMTSASISKYRQQIKKAYEALATEREEKRKMQEQVWKLEEELHLFKQNQNKLKNLDGEADVKLVSVR